MHSLRSAAVQYTNYGTGGAFELPTQSGTYIYIYIYIYILTRNQLYGALTVLVRSPKYQPDRLLQNLKEIIQWNFLLTA